MKKCRTIFLILITSNLPQFPIYLRLNLFRLFPSQLALSYIKPKMAPKSTPTHVITPPFSAALFTKTVIAPKTWRESDPDLPRLGYMFGKSSDVICLFVSYF